MPVVIQKTTNDGYIIAVDGSNATDRQMIERNVKILFHDPSAHFFVAPRELIAPTPSQTDQLPLHSPDTIELKLWMRA